MNVNVLLVDDEAVDLEWLRRRVVDSGLDLRVIAAVNSGFKALKVMEHEQVDLILCDIRMPIMSGIEFARRVKEHHPGVKIVFISGHEDFEYAKEAISISVSGYLLKPVDDQELYDMVSGLCDAITREQEQDRTYTEALTLLGEGMLLRWLNGISPEQVAEHVQGLLIPMLQAGTVAAIVEVDDVQWKAGGLNEEERDRQLHKVFSFVQYFAAEIKLGTFIMDQPARYVLLAGMPEHLFLEWMEELVRAVRQISPFSVTIGVGREARTEEDLRDSYRQAQAALSAKWLVGKNRLIRENRLLTTENRLVSEQTDDIVKRMLKAILGYDLVAIDDGLVELFYHGRPLAYKNDAYDLIIRMTGKLHAGLREIHEDLYELLRWDAHQPELLFQFETIHDIVSWLRKRLFELSELLYAKKTKQKRRVIEEVIQYVEDHLEQKITLKEVATHFDFSPNYLGHLFKEETGEHFSDFLNELRTRRICTLLQDPGFRIYEIAERMGYRNIIYFNRQFKQATGMTPGEYRKALRV